MGDIWQYITPDAKGKRGRPKDTDSTAIRAKWFNEQTQTKSKPVAQPKVAKRSLKSFLLLAPWSSIVSWAFLVTGLIIYTLNAKKLSTRTSNLLDLTNSDENPYNKYLETIVSSHVVSGILGIVCIIVGAIASWIHIKHVVGGPWWGSFRRFSLTLLLALELVYLVACLVWFLLIMNYTSSWSTALWSIEQASSEAAMVLETKQIDAEQGCIPACMNLRQFPFLKTNSCICDYQGAVNIQTLASKARGKAIWLLVGISCAAAGIVLSIINVAADIGGVYVSITPEIVRCSCLEEGKVGATLDDSDSQTRTKFQMPSLTPGSIQARTRISM